MEELSIVTDSDGKRQRLLNKMKIEAGDEIAFAGDVVRYTNRENVANIISDFIINEYEKKLIYKLVHHNYCYLTPGERNTVYQKAAAYAQNESNSIIDRLLYKRRAEIISEKLSDYLESAGQLVLDGFVNFRLREYTEELEEIIDKAVEDFLVEKEYTEFIALLRYFVEVQPSKEELVHIVVDGTQYRIFNKEHHDITDRCVREFSTEEESANNDDLLISVLIMLSPKNILIHNLNEENNKEIFVTIKNVFRQKVSYCNGCRLCYKQ